MGYKKYFSVITAWIIGILFLITTGTIAQQADTSIDFEALRDGLPLTPECMFTRTLTEGSWISVDVHPSGEWVVFDLLGDLYEVPIEGGEARRLTHGMAFDAQQRYSPDGERDRLTRDEYGKFEMLWTSTLSPYGTWIAARIVRVDDEEELRMLNVEADSTMVFPWGRTPTFSSDGTWLAWAVGVSQEERERLEKEELPVREDAAVLNTETGEVKEWKQVRAFSFDARGRYLALHGYPPEEPEGKGVDLRVVALGTGQVMSFGNVDSYAWSDTGSLLALAIATGTDDGNGVQLYDAASGRVYPLDTSGSSYRHLAWREDAADLAVLRSSEPAGEAASSHEVVVWRDVDLPGAEAFVLEGLPEPIADTLNVVGHRTPEWSKGGRRIAIGLRPVPPAEPDDEDKDRKEERSSDDDDSADSDEPDEDEDLPDLQIWHTSDVRIVPRQQAQAETDALRTLLAVWTPDNGRVVQVGTDLRGRMEPLFMFLPDANITADWRFGLERISEQYSWGVKFGRPFYDVWAVDLESGERTRVLEKVRHSWESEGGRYLLSFDGEDYHAHDLHTGTAANLTAGLAADFANLEYDTPTDMLPPHGVGGWLEGDEGVLLHDRYDVWHVRPDGNGGERLTAGAEEEVIHRLLQVEQEADSFPSDRPIYLSLRQEPTERRGFAQLTVREAVELGASSGSSGQAAPEPERSSSAGAAVERMMLEDAWPRQLVRADSADVFLFRSEATNVSPELFLAGPGLSDRQRVMRTNPFVENYAWTRPELFHFESEAGDSLKGVLYYPAGYEPSKQYPMIVFNYELLSQWKHWFYVPNERNPYNPAVWTQEGYFVLYPDIVYRAREPGVSALEAIRPAVNAVLERGLVDPDRVGLIGHSWGGYQATYIPTQTDMFAASVAGAPLTDFKSFMGQIHWAPGLPEVDHWETGQARMEVPYWEDVEAHLRNSPLHHVHNMNTPLLMAFGDQDGVVEWWQGTVFYNFARRAGKQMVLLVYEDEGHGLQREANQVDYNRRILEWFGHYLKDEPAPAWIIDGVTLENLEAEKKRIQASSQQK